MRQGLGGEARESWVTLFLPQFLSSHPVLISWLTSPLCLPHYILLHMLMPWSCTVWREDTSTHWGWSFSFPFPPTLQYLQGMVVGLDTAGQEGLP